MTRWGQVKYRQPSVTEPHRIGYFDDTLVVWTAVPKSFDHACYRVMPVNQPDHPRDSAHRLYPLQRVENFNQPCPKPVVTVFGRNRCSARSAKSPAQLHVPRQPIQCLGDGFCGPVLDQESRLSVGDDLRGTPLVGSYNGQAVRPRLEVRDAKPLTRRWKGEDVRPPIPVL